MLDYPRYDQFNLSEKGINFFHEYETQKSITGISLLEFFRQKGLIYDPQPVDESDEVIEEIKKTTTSRMVINAVICIIIVAACIGLYFVMRLIPYIIISVLGLIIVFVLVSNFFGGFHTKITIYKERLVYKWKAKKETTIFFKDIMSVQEKTATGKDDRNFKSRFIMFLSEFEFIPFYLELILFKDLDDYFIEITLFNNTKIPISVLRFGGRKEVIAKKLINYILQANPKISPPEKDIFRKFDREINKKILYATDLLAKNEIGTALDEIIELLIKSEKNSKVWKLTALILSRIIPEESFPFIETAISFSKNDADLWNAKGQAFEVTGNIEFAIDSYKKALIFDSDHDLANTNLNRLTVDASITSGKEVSLLKQDSTQLTGAKELSKKEKILPKDIKLVKEIIGKKTTLAISDLQGKLEMNKDKIIQILTEHLDFVLIDGRYVKEVLDTIDKDYRAIERVRFLIGNKTNLEVNYLEKVTGFSKEDLSIIIQDNLGYTIKNGRVIQED